MNKDFIFFKTKEVDQKWIKNFYFNRTSVQKLLFLYSFLNNETFNSILSKRIKSFDFITSKEAKSCLFDINDKLVINVKIVEFSFGFVWIFESTVVYYFKSDFDFEEFYFHFSNIEMSENFVWKSIEFFDKTIKILEIFKKNSLIRIYRDETIDEKNKKIKKIKYQKIDLNKKESFLFIKKYQPKNIKLILYFYKF